MKLFIFFLFSQILTDIDNQEDYFEEDSDYYIQINEAKIRGGNFIIQSNLHEIATKVKLNLISTKRFIYHETFNNKVNFCIKINLLEDNKISVEIFDYLQNKIVKKFKIKGSLKDIIRIISNKIYKLWTNEEGIFDSEIIFTTYLGQGQFCLCSTEFNKSYINTISQPINEISDIILIKQKIFITKLASSGFSIYSYNKDTQKFFKIISIESGSVFSPAIYNNELFISVAYKGTTGIYKLPFNSSKSYQNFNEFINDPNVENVTKINNKIATSVNVFNNLKIFCANYDNSAAIYILPNRKISSANGAYYDPVLLNETYLAAIKVHNQFFNLVIINLKTGEESEPLLKKYYIGKPAWSPCGNWIAVSCRDKNKKDKIILVHKSGKYKQIITTNYSIKNVIWMKNY